MKGTMVPGELQNAYYEFTALGGRQMLIFSLEWGPRQAVVVWANTIAGQPQYADHTAVLLTHAYMNHNEQRYNWAVSQDGGNPHAYSTADDTNDGEELWNELVKKHGNFAITLNGHVGGDGVAYLASAGDEGNTVHQMLVNTQFETNGGNGWIRILEFLKDGDTVRVRTYSPYHDLYRTDPANDFVFKFSDVVPPPGDLNRNGVVDAADYVLWRDSLNSNTNPNADANGDGTVSIRDYYFWRERFGDGSPGPDASPLASVPEASGMILAFLAATALGPLGRPKLPLQWRLTAAARIHVDHLHFRG